MRQEGNNAGFPGIHGGPWAPLAAARSTAGPAARRRLHPQKTPQGKALKRSRTWGFPNSGSAETLHKVFMGISACVPPSYNLSVVSQQFLMGSQSKSVVLAPRGCATLFSHWVYTALGSSGELCFPIDYQICTGEEPQSIFPSESRSKFRLRFLSMSNHIEKKYDSKPAEILLI